MPQGCPVDGPNGLSRIVCQPMVFTSPATAIANGSVPTTTSRCSGSYRREIVPSATGAASSRASHRLLVPSLTHIADRRPAVHRPEEHPSELQSLMRTSYPVFCLK